MAIIQFVGFETGDASECFFSAGTVDFTNTSVKRTGTYALRVNPTTTGTGQASIGIQSATGANGQFSLSNLFFTFYFRYATKPAANSEEILSVAGAAGGNNGRLRLRSDGKLELFTTVSQVVGTATLAQDTWYRIECNWNDTANTQEVKVDGTVDITGAIATGQAAVTLDFGKVVNRNGQTVDFFYDDICIDNAGYPGAGEVKMGTAIGAGADSAWDGGTGTTFAEVNDLATQAGNDGDTTYIGAAATEDNSDHTFDMSAYATIGISGAIGAVKTIVIARSGSTSGTSTSAHRRIISGVATELTALELPTSYATYAVVDLDDTVGGGGSAFDATSFDSVEVGMAANAIAQVQRFTAVYISAWSAGSSGPGPQSVAGTQPAASGAVTFKQVNKQLAGTQPQATGTAVAKFVNKLLTGTQPQATGTIAAKTVNKFLQGTQPQATGTIAADIVFRQIGVAGTQPQATGALDAVSILFSTVTGVQPQATGTVVGLFTNKFLQGAQPQATGALAFDITLRHISLAGAQPNATGTIAAKTTNKQVAGVQPQATGSIAAHVTFAHITVAGVQPQATGSVAGVAARFVDVAGTQPQSTGTAVGLFKVKFLAGAQPQATGTVAFKRVLSHITLSGTQPQATGSITGEIVGAVEVDVFGHQPQSTGAVAADIVFRQVSVAGVQPSASGSIASHFVFYGVTVTGVQPQASGSIAAVMDVTITIEGHQPASTGTIAFTSGWHRSIGMIGSTSPSLSKGATLRSRQFVGTASVAVSKGATLPSRDFIASSSQPIEVS